MKKSPQYVHFRCGKMHTNSSLNNIGISYNVPPSLVQQGMELDEFFEATWEARDNEWLPYVKNDGLSTAFCYARYTMGMTKVIEK